MSYIYDLLDTWNDGATTFTAVKMNVTDTASNASSLLMDLQVGGAGKFNVRKDGSTYITNGIVAMGANGGGPLFISTVAGAVGYNMASVLGVGWTNSAVSAIAAPDTILTRRAAANLRFGAADAAAPVAQTLSVQSVVAGTSNTAGANLTITGSQGTGTGAGGSIIFQVAPAGGSGTAQNALTTRLQISVANAGIEVNNHVYSPSGSALYFASNGYVFGGQLMLNSASKKLQLPSDHMFSWSNDTTSYGTSDVILNRDAANTLALRNGTAAQAFRVYNTWTSFGSGTEIWERGNIFWDSNVLKIGTEKGANGGTARELEFQTNGTTKLTITTTAGSAKFGQGPNGQFGWYNTYGNLVFEAYESSSVRKFVLNGLLLFDGVSSSFPALKRSSTTLQARLADDSAFASVQGKLTTDTNYTAGTFTATGYLTLYDAAGTAYRVPCAV